MTALGIIAKIDGQKERFFPQFVYKKNSLIHAGKDLVGFDEQFFTFDETSPEIVMLARSITDDGDSFTWVGQYGHLEKKYAGRGGGYVGVGLLLHNATISGARIYATIKPAFDHLSDIFRHQIAGQPTADGNMRAALSLFERIRPESLGLQVDFHECLVREARSFAGNAGLGGSPYVLKPAFLLLQDMKTDCEQAIDYFQITDAVKLQSFNRIVLTDSERLAEILRQNRCPAINDLTEPESASFADQALTEERAVPSATPAGKPQVTPNLPGLADNRIRNELETILQQLEGSFKRQIEALHGDMQRLRDRTAVLEQSSRNMLRSWAGDSQPPATTPIPVGQIAAGKKGEQAKLPRALASFDHRKVLWILILAICAAEACALIVIKLPSIEAYLSPQVAADNYPPVLPPTPPGISPSVAENTAKPDVAAVPTNDVDMRAMVNGMYGLIPADVREPFVYIDESELQKIAQAGGLPAARTIVEEDPKLRTAYDSYVKNANMKMVGFEQFVTILELDRCLTALKNTNQISTKSFNADCVFPSQAFENLNH